MAERAVASGAGSAGQGDIAVAAVTAPSPAAIGLAREVADLAAVRAGGRPRLRLWRALPAVAIGRAQAVAREVRLTHCRAESIPILRRPGGGGALWLDPGQVCLSLAIEAAALGATPAARLERTAELLGAALARLGVATRFRAPNDLEVVGGAKIASVFLAEEGAAALVFATVLVDFDVRAAMTALLVPTEKLTVSGLEHARERVTTLIEVLGRAPEASEIEAAIVAAFTEGLGLVPVAGEAAAVAPLGDLAAVDDPWGAALDHGFETEDKTGQATLRLRLELEPATTRVATARFASDAAVVPVGLAERIAAALGGAELGEVPARMAGVAEALAAETAVGFGGGDLVRLAERAAAKAELAARIGLDAGQTSGLMLAGSARDAAEALSRATVMLVPYCAKPAWCALRPTPDCIDCGHCEVGDAYRLARERGLDVTTITNFEHLSETLSEMKARGVTSYVGMCCSDFFLKRHVAFREAGMDAVLMDIVGATCYELKEEHLAYAGVFKAEANLDLDALEKVMSLVPGCETGCEAAERCGARGARGDRGGADPSPASGDDRR